MGVSSSKMRSIEVQIDGDVCIRDFAGRCRHLIEARVRHDVGFVVYRQCVFALRGVRRHGRSGLGRTGGSARRRLETSSAAMSRPEPSASDLALMPALTRHRLTPVEALATAGAGASNLATGREWCLASEDLECGR